ncbi:Gfo/Idh/MocA family protein [Haloplasma contractile]|uniref:NADH-dependent dehydrogenase protein n=1 Tax=Haloplasma contractile SSD-17B TaxID=1033810 RepID=U2FK84_9MOLU|nr:Gfo/Idh/MocA family oxidoreductase [Haloplasma contractile]ERJ11644.1 putative NADH-dependent dehydrogenase protein [Haloplasma contractile SSD-17B]
MKILQIGLGEFGMSWFKDILLHHQVITEIIVVDHNKKKLEEAKQYDHKQMCNYYQSLDHALKEQVDLVLNVTPPHEHKDTVDKILEHNIPILLEKPISTCYKDAIAILKRSEDKNIPVMIAENYRYQKKARKVKKLLTNGVIGKISSVNIDFYRNHHMENYHKDLQEPLLLDVAIHHLDVARYLVEQEIKTVYSRLFNPSWSWYKGNASVHLDLLFNNDIVVNYRGSLVSHKNDTDWDGSWRIEGERGVLYMKDSMITVINDEGELTYKINTNEDGRISVLNEFIQSLREKRNGETDIHDNIKTFDIVQKAIEQNINKH